MIHAAQLGMRAPRVPFLTGMDPAVRLAGLVLGLATVLAGGWPGAVLAVLLGGVGLARTGLAWRAQIALLKPWWWLALLVVATHTLTTTAGAPLGRPSWAGLAAGALALARLAGSLQLLGLFVRTGTLDDLVAGLRWWLRPLERLGLPVDELGLVLAVAMGTVPTVLADGRRLQAVTRLRQGAGPGAGGGWPRTLRPQVWLQQAALAVPLLEGLARRADAVTLSLRHRRPLPRPRTGGTPWVPLAVLGAWGAGLLLLAWARSSGQARW